MKDKLATAAITVFVVFCMMLVWVLFENCEAKGGVIRAYAGCLDPSAVK